MLIPFLYQSDQINIQAVSRNLPYKIGASGAGPAPPYGRPDGPSAAGSGPRVTNEPYNRDNAGNSAGPGQLLNCGPGS